MNHPQMHVPAVDARLHRQCISSSQKHSTMRATLSKSLSMPLAEAQSCISG